jgi:PAS domain S-box-containing protein
MLVKTRLQINVAVSVLTAVVVILVLLLAFTRINRALEESYLAGEIILCAYERNTLRSDYLATGSERAKKQWFAKHEQLGRLLDAASRDFRGAEDRTNLQELVKDHQVTGRIFSAIVANREQARPDAASAALAKEAENRMVSQLRMRVYERTLYAINLDEGARSRLYSALWLAAWAIAGMISLAAAAAVANSWTMFRTIADRIARLRVGASTIGRGNFGHRIDIEGEDEFAELSGAFNAMTGKLRTSYLDLENQIAERRSAEEELRRSEAQLRLFFEHTPAAIAMFDTEMKYLLASHAWYTDYGLTGQQIIGRSHYEVFPEIPQRWKEIHLRCLAGASEKCPEDSFRRTDGSTEWVRWEIRPWLAASGAVGGIIIFTGVITDLKKAQDALRELNAQLEARVTQRTEELEAARAELEVQNAQLQEAYSEQQVQTAERIRILEELRQQEQLLIQQSRLAAMGEMLMNIAHQWRQPLNVLGLKLQELGLCYQCGSFSEQLLQGNIRQAMEIIQHLSQTISDFQSFLAPDREKTPFQVEQVIAKTVGLLEENFRNHGIGIDVVSTGTPRAFGYPGAYGQVVLNLLSNAKDALLERAVTGGVISVRSWTEEDGRTVATVADNAGGIPEEILDRIFDAYFTTKELGKGTGVGLFMAKTIIEKNMGGRLTVRNVGPGAEFRIEV